MNNYNVSDEPVTEVEVDINDIKDTCNEKGRNEECVFLVAGRMIYRKGLDFLFDALMTIPQETRYQVRVVGDGPELVHLRKRCKDNLNLSEHVHCMGSICYNPGNFHRQIGEIDTYTEDAGNCNEKRIRFIWIYIIFCDIKA